LSLLRCPKFRGLLKRAKYQDRSVAIFSLSGVILASGTLSP
jgi:hypothetical protein